MGQNKKIDASVEELLPFYVNETLDEEERRLVEQAAFDDEDLQQQIEALRLVRAHIKVDETATSPGDAGLERLMSEIDPAIIPLPANSPAKPLFRMSGFAAGVMAASIALAFYVGTTTQRDETFYVQASGEETSATLTVEFQSDVSHQLVSNTLMEHGLIIVDGPSARGFYRLEMLDEGDRFAMANALREKVDVFRFVDVPQ